MIEIFQATKGTIVRVAGMCITMVAACITRNALQQNYGTLAGIGVVVVGTISIALIASKLDSVEEMQEEMHDDEIELMALIPLEDL